MTSRSRRAPPVTDATEPSRWRLLALLTVIQTGMSALQFSLIALLPIVKDDLGAGVTQAAMLASVVSAGTLLTAVPAGRVADRYGERRTLVGGALLAGAAMTAAALVSNVWLMLPVLLLAGTGVVTSHPAGVRVIMRRFSNRERGGAIAIRQTAVPLGGALTAVVLPLIAGPAGWRGAIAAVGLLAVALAVLARLGLPADQPATAVAGARGGSITGLLRNRDLMLATALTLCLNAGQVSVVTFIALYVHDQLGHPLALASALLAAVQLSGIVGRILWGVVSDRALHGRRRPLLVWLSGGGAATALLLALSGAGSPVWLFWAAALLTGMTLLGWNALAIALSTESAGLAGAATAMAFGTTAVALVNVAVPLAGGALVDATGGYRPLWVAAAAVVALAVPLSLLVHERHARG